MRWGKQRWLIGFVALVVLAGCGARVSDAQRAQAAGATRGAPAEA
ncbi:MAG: hypothetical protein JWN67_4411, partial [Actinomycetia bacterium]|nr:hypothetical protein [Actinomycetes bacterium]